MSSLLCCGLRKLSDFNMQIIIIVKLKKYCGSPEQKSSIIPSHISTALPILTHYSTVLPLRVELIHTSWTHQIFMYLHIAYQPRPQQKLSAISCQTWWCARNNRWNNNIWFLATLLFFKHAHIKCNDLLYNHRISGLPCGRLIAFCCLYHRMIPPLIVSLPGPTQLSVACSVVSYVGKSMCVNEATRENSKMNNY